MRVSKIFNRGLIIDSKSFKDLSPKMKNVVSDIFRVVMNKQGGIIERFDFGIKMALNEHSFDLESLYEYFDKEILEQLGEK